ncbi:unannotated protein [freshwater metagenome]|uniref:Unannotated protein n=1 Tax=freshwater metagenome TaxID=449393 RepID=A0A6J7CVE2_9ZZZZ
MRDPACRERLFEVLEQCFADNMGSWDLRRDGTWVRNAPGPGEEPRSVQRELIAQALAQADAQA